MKVFIAKKTRKNKCEGNKLSILIANLTTVFPTCAHAVRFLVGLPETAERQRDRGQDQRDGSGQNHVEPDRKHGTRWDATRLKNYTLKYFPTRLSTINLIRSNFLLFR